MMITATEVARRLKTQPQSVLALIQSNILPSKQIGRRRRMWEPSLCAALKRFHSGPGFMPSTVFPDDFLTLEEAAGVMRISKQTVLRWIHRKSIPSYRFSERIMRVRDAELRSNMGEVKGE